MAQTIKLKRSAVAGRIPNVSDLELGEIAINTYDGKMYIKKSVNGEESISEIGQDANLGAVFTSYTFTATANQTVFTGNDNSGNALDIVDEFSNVFMNGILLDPEIDFTVSSDGLTLTLTEPAEADDILQISSFDQAIFNGTLNVDALALTGMTGQMAWNSDEETIDVPLNDDVTLQLGQEFVFRGKATEAISNGDAVMFAGAQGGHLLIAKADMSSVGFAPEYVIGIATQDFNTNDFGFVTELGKVRGLDTSGYSEGDILYLDPTTPGALTVTKPIPPNHAIQMCAVVNSHITQGTLLVRPTHMVDTDEVAEGSSNLYFTVARAVAAIKADGDWNASEWDTAYSWGDHSTEGYLTTIPTPVNASWWNGGFVKVGADGVMEMGKYMDFHTSNTGGNVDYDLRVTVSPGVFSVGGQVNLSEQLYSTSSDIVINTPYARTLWYDGSYGARLIQQAWASGIGDHITIRAGGNGTNVDHKFGQSFADLGGHLKISGTTVIDSSRNIVNVPNAGIGVSTPERALHVNSGSVNEAARFESTDTACKVEFKDLTGTASIETRDDFRFNTGGVLNRVIISRDGYVGIRTTTPSYQMQIMNVSGTPGFAVTRSTDFNNPLVKINTDSTKNFIASNGDLLLSTTTTGNENYLERLRITEGGNVGVGASSPLRKFHVAGNFAVNNSTSEYYGVNMGGGEGDDPFITVGDWHNAGARLWWDSSARSFNIDTQYGTNPGTFNITGNDGAETFFRISNVGNVGINKTDPETTLDVAGTIKSDQNIINAISEVKGDSAVDVFVYDTRKDSDGGAWRKRTQHTSWYNETLNTATRGSRKEFPAVAVIVAEVNKVTIYDGDDPEMPMWMVFVHSGYGNMLGEHTNSSVCMMNARIVLGCDPYDLYITDFLLDSGWSHSTTSGISGTFVGNISQRNIGYGREDLDSWVFGTVPNIINRYVNDVAMTVLPNAPIDPATGLPVPTIAVATDGGISIIKDDGSIVDITANAGSSYNRADWVTFDGTKVLFTQDGSTYRTVHYVEIPSSDTLSVTNSSGLSDKVYFWGGDGVSTVVPNFLNRAKGVVVGNEHHYLKGDAGYGLTMLNPKYDNKSQGLSAFVQTNYNTGWLSAGTYLATLSDTDNTAIVGTELVTNGTFDSDISGWTSDGGGTAVWDNGTIKVSDVTSNMYINQEVPVTIGKTYTLSLEVTSMSGQAGLSSSSSWGSNVFPSVGYHSYTVKATTGTLYIRLYSATAGGHVNLDNISVRLSEEDRSLDNNALQVFGTVQKNPVATGADLVAYSGFTTSNYLSRYMDWTIGTGDFSFSFWVKPPSTVTSYFHAISIGTPTTGGQLASSGLVLKLNTGDSSPYFYTGSGAASFDTYSASNNVFVADSWNHFYGGRKNGVFYMYINGRLTKTGATNNLNITDNHLVIGVGLSQSEVVPDTKIALVKVSKTFLPTEQIEKIYNDEKVLFQENAKCTLYGDTNTVTALAYDEDTNLLHAGTSEGRSVFQGLRRVDSTTDAVASSISASNGIVVEG